MKKIINEWKYGLAFLFDDDLISFYTFFTIVLSEIAFLWAFMPISQALPFTFILSGYILNVIISAFIQGMWETTITQKIFSVIYIFIFIGLLVTGCFFSIVVSILTFIIPIAITALWIRLRFFQDTEFAYQPAKFTEFISKIFHNKVFYVFSQIVVVGGPIILLTIFIVFIPMLPIAFKIIIPIIYCLIIPLIVALEDETAACNIFELAYDAWMW